MAKTYSYDVTLFIAHLSRYLGKLPNMGEVDAVLRDARKLATWAERDCNDGLSERDQNCVDRAEKRIAAQAKAWGLVAVFSRDPRGMVVKFRFIHWQPQDQPYNTFGGIEDGWGIA